MTRRLRLPRSWAIWLYFVCALALAAATYTDFLHELGKRESSLKPGALNQFGYAGLFQMGELAMIDAGYYIADGTSGNDWKGAFTGADGVTSLSSFLANPDAQIKAVSAYHQQVWGVIQHLGLASHVGKTINGVQITQSGLVAGAHLVGYQRLKSYLQSNGSVVPKDGNGTPITLYIQKFGGFTVGGSPPTYASLLAAAGGPGVPATASPPATAPSTGQSAAGGAGPTPALPAAPALSGQSPQQAFLSNTGYAQGDVAETIKLLVAASLFLWLAWTMLSAWTRFSDGQLHLLQLKTDAFRSVILMLVVITLLT